MAGPRIDQINVVVTDVEASAEFLRGLGLSVPELTGDWRDWAPHHQGVPTAADGPFSIDLDSSAFAAWWGGVPASFTGVVLDVRVDDREEVDRLHELALTLGARTLKAPCDAFWGSRFACVEAPGPLVVGLLSVGDDEHRSPAPPLSDFA